MKGNLHCGSEQRNVQLLDYEVFLQVRNLSYAPNLFGKLATKCQIEAVGGNSRVK
jgi:hypothetical protein